MSLTDRMLDEAERRQKPALIAQLVMIALILALCLYMAFVKK